MMKSVALLLSMVAGFVAGVAPIDASGRAFFINTATGTLAADAQAAFDLGTYPATYGQWKDLVKLGVLEADLGITGPFAVLSGTEYKLVESYSQTTVPYTIDSSNTTYTFIKVTPPTCAATALPVRLSDVVAIGTASTSGVVSVVDSCMCYSQYSGPLCDVFTTATGCPATVNNSNALTGQQMIRGGVDGGSINGISDTLMFTIDSPQMTTRLYTSFNWVNCSNSATTFNNALREYNGLTDVASCNDTWNLVYVVAELVPTCGLNTTNMMLGTSGPVPSPDWIRYRGDFIVNYNETVSINLFKANTTIPLSQAGVQNMTRTGRLVTPVDAYFERLGNATLNTANTSIFVVSAFQLKGTIVATTVKANQTTATVSIVFGITSPYQIVWLSNNWTDAQNTPVIGVEWEANNAAAPLGGAYVMNGDIAILTDRVVIDDGSGLKNCTSYDSFGFCWNQITILIVVPPTTCTLDHTFTFEQVAVFCNNDYSTSDCPLDEVDASSKVSFTVTAADFCDGQRPMVIGGVITILAYVPQLTANRLNATDITRLYTMGSRLWLTLFLDTEKSLTVYNLTMVTFQTKITNGAFADPANVGTYLAAANGNAVVDGIPQGWDVATQTHSMAITLRCNLVMEGGVCQLNPSTINGGELFTQITFYVNYEDVRRRRRQAANARGYASQQAQMTVTPEAGADVAPVGAASSITGTVRLVATVAAALCAVFLL